MTEFVLTMLLVSLALFFAERPLRPKQGSRKNQSGPPAGGAETPGASGVARAMAVGGLLNAKKVADTMANKITDMNPGQGFAANLATALLLNDASYHGLPVSTTQVSVGSLLGIGITRRQTKWKPVIGGCYRG